MDANTLSTHNGFDIDPTQEWEIVAMLKHSRSGSTPSPFDQIAYTIFMKCISLCHALIDI